jgi:hypothetical protein
VIILKYFFEAQILNIHDLSTSTQDEEKQSNTTTQYMFDTKPYSLIKYILTDF